MKVTDKSLLAQVGVDGDELKRRLRLSGVDAATSEVMVGCQAFVTPVAEQVVERFFERQTAFFEIDWLIGDAGTLKQLKEVIRGYVVELFDGLYDLEYAERRLRIGIVHKRIGVEPKLFFGAQNTLRAILLEVIGAHSDGMALFHSRVTALDRLLSFDAALIMDTYVHTMLSEVEVARDRMAGYARDLEREVAERTRKLEELSRTDPLTGLFNQRSLDDNLAHHLALAKRGNEVMSLIYFDLDQFKEINDGTGHIEGNRILQMVGRVLRDVLREVDVPCRYGGDEFCVILPGADVDDAIGVCGRLIEMWEETASPVTLSIGVIQAGPDRYDTCQGLIARADALMYEAKQVTGNSIRTGWSGDGPPMDLAAEAGAGG